MSESNIAPLAKQLAEENNVDWRALQGSGPDGSVVEKDVLNYLAKVMAGEEAINPTAEPTPEGMEAWPEEDVKAFEAEQTSSQPAAEEEVSWDAFADASPTSPAEPSPVEDQLGGLSLDTSATPAPSPAPAASAPSTPGISSAEYQAALNEIERLKAEVKRAEDGASQQLGTLQSENAQLKSQLSQLQSEQNQLKRDLESAQSSAASQGATKDENEKVKAKLEKAKAEISRQRETLEKAKRQIEGLRGELAEATKKKPWWKLFG